MLIVMLGAEDLGSFWRKPNIAAPMAMATRQIVVKGWSRGLQEAVLEYDLLLGLKVCGYPLANS